MSRYIDADELRKKMVPHGRGLYGYSADVKDWAILVSDLDAAPAAKVREDISAKFVKDENGDVFCGNCGFEFEDHGDDYVPCFCPDCGASLDRESAYQ